MQNSKYLANRLVLAECINQPQTHHRQVAVKVPYDSCLTLSLLPDQLLSLNVYAFSVVSNSLSVITPQNTYFMRKISPRNLALGNKTFVV